MGEEVEEDGGRREGWREGRVGEGVGGERVGGRVNERRGW